MTPFNMVINQVANYLSLDAAELLSYAQEDTIGGYEPHANTRWLPGSIWGAEGQILYAITRAMKPQRIAELGALQGCGTSHFSTALKMNGSGKVSTYDNFRFRHAPFKVADDLEPYYEFIVGDAYEIDLNPFQIVFEDFNDTAAGVKRVWSRFIQEAQPGAVILTHDVYHHHEGKEMRAGIEASGAQNVLMFQIDGTDCGLGMWRKS